MTDWHVVVLAAGRGRRMGSAVHKALLRVCDGGGTLDLILTWVSERQPLSVTVVTGLDDSGIVGRARSYPGVRTRRNPDPDPSGMLGSLAVGIADLVVTDPLLVLLGDTVYREDFQRALDELGTGTAIPVRRPPAGRLPEVPVELRGNLVAGLGGSGDLEMASAVLWGPRDVHVIAPAAARGFTTQWQVLNPMVRSGARVEAVEVASDSLFDVDTPADLDEARRRLL